MQNISLVRSQKGLFPPTQPTILAVMSQSAALRKRFSTIQIMLDCILLVYSTPQERMLLLKHQVPAGLVTSLE